MPSGGSKGLSPITPGNTGPLRLFIQLEAPVDDSSLALFEPFCAANLKASHAPKSYEELANNGDGNRGPDATNPSAMAKYDEKTEDKPTLFHKVKNERSILALAVSDSRLFAGTQAGEILVSISRAFRPKYCTNIGTQVWSLETYERIDSIKAHHRSVLSLYVAKDEELLFSSGGDAIVNVSGYGKIS